MDRVQEVQDADGKADYRLPDGAPGGSDWAGWASGMEGAEGGGRREAPPGGAECDLRAARRESRWGRAVGLVARSEALGL